MKLDMENLECPSQAQLEILNIFWKSKAKRLTAHDIHEALKSDAINPDDYTRLIDTLRTHLHRMVKKGYLCAESVSDGGIHYYYSVMYSREEILEHFDIFGKMVEMFQFTPVEVLYHFHKNVLLTARDKVLILNFLANVSDEELPA